jgi:hypothetical protein
MLCGQAKENWVKKSQKHAPLALQNGFGPASFHRMLSEVKGTAEPNIYDRIIGLLVPVSD